MKKTTTEMSEIKEKENKFKYHLAKGSDWRWIKTIQNPDAPIEQQIWVENDYIRGLRSVGAIFVNDSFMPLWMCDSKLMFLAGGYGSSKTTFVITMLLVKCMTFDYFKCFFGRLKKTEARQLHKNIIREIKRNGWTKFFHFSEAPNGNTEIKCNINGNLFEMFGCDDVDSLKGIDNPSHIFVDEINQLDFKTFGMLFSRLRVPGCELQMIGNFNNCDVYQDHWLAKFIYFEEFGGAMKMTGEESPEEKENLETLSKINIVKHHSTYLDNMFQNPDSYLQTLRLQAGGDKDKIKAFAEGRWGVSLSSQPFYKQFKKEDVVAFCEYNPDLPLHVSWDENANPYLPIIICQVIGKTLYVIDEIAARNPNNSLQWVCDKIMKDYPLHTAGMYIYGDATSVKDEVKMEKGKNMFVLMKELLSKYNPTIRKQNSNPNVATRGNFINCIFSMGYEDIKIVIHPKCVHLIEDFINCEEAPDGTSKNKTKEMVDGKRGVQRWGHFTDAFDYLICQLFIMEYSRFKTLGRASKVSGGTRLVNNSIDREEVLVEEEFQESKEQKQTQIRRISYGKRFSNNGLRD